MNVKPCSVFLRERFLSRSSFVNSLATPVFEANYSVSVKTRWNVSTASSAGTTTSEMAIVAKLQRARERREATSVVEQKEAVRRQETINWNILSIVGAPGTGSGVQLHVRYTFDEGRSRAKSGILSRRRLVSSLM